MRRAPIAIAAAAALLLGLPAAAAPAPGTLIKLACPAGADAAHPCKAVYFHGRDGARHAFPNEKVYFTWYADFASVKTVTSAEMAALPLGRNVTYRPGAKPVKFLTDPKVYAVGLGGGLRWIQSEADASALYGADWATRVDDVADAYYLDYRFESQAAAPSSFSPSAESALAPGIDDDLPATLRSETIAAPAGAFRVDYVKLQKDRFAMKTVAAEQSDCANGCAVKPLKTFAQELGARIGIHGTYFCPPDYADCAGKTDTFLWPFFHSPTRTMRNASSLPVHQGPFVAQGGDGRYRYYHRTEDFVSAAQFEAVNGTPLAAGIANYPSLLENGAAVWADEPKLDDGMKTVKGTRGGIGYDDRFIYLVIARSASVPDLASVFQALGATHAMNLDGGGSSALLFGGEYAVGPGRELPNAIVFAPR